MDEAGALVVVLAAVVVGGVVAVCWGVGVDWAQATMVRVITSTNATRENLSILIYSSSFNKCF